MKDIDKELDTQIDEPDILQELFENYHIVKYDNIDGYTRLGDSESDWYELYTSIKALIATQINQARIDELKRWEAPENEIMMTFADPCNICGFNYKTLRQAQQDRLKELKGE